MGANEVQSSNLTKAQAEAVCHQSGPLLVLAGPGSGKTTVVTRRIAQLVANGVPPKNILALTFTNKAATEMRERVYSLLNYDKQKISGLTVATFHSFCAQFLRVWGERIIGTNTFSIYNATDQKSAIKEAIFHCELDGKNWKPDSIHSTISSAKNLLIDCNQFKNEANDFYSKTVAEIYIAYQNILKTNDAVDFDDLLMLTAKLLDQDTEVRQRIEDRYQYLMVDEYQDTNYTQFIIANQIASNSRNLCVVGDPDQSIYAWRGADISNILNFESQYPDASVIPLGQNFRSTGFIVQTAATLIAHNKQRRDKAIYTELEVGERPIVKTLDDEYVEGLTIIEQVQLHHANNRVPLKEMAVLYRVNSLSRVIEDAFRNAGIPYVVARGTAFYDRKEIKQAISYLQLIVNTRNNVACSRIINMPPRGIGKTSLKRLSIFSGQRGISLLDACALVQKADGFTARSLNALHEFSSTCLQWRVDAQSEESLTASASLADLVERVVRESGLETLYSKDSTEENFERVQNLEELISAATEFESRISESYDQPPTPMQLLEDYLEQIALVSDADIVDEDNGAVTLMTLHAAKGLEFEFVAIAGLEESLLPHQRAIFDDVQLEEERRLCFVGLTRAKKYLLLTMAKRRMHRGLTDLTTPSRFLSEMDGSHLLIEEPIKEAFAAPKPSDIEQNAGIRLGVAVRHKRFGIGKVQRIIRRKRGSTVTVQFASTVKHLVLEYANLEVLDDDFEHIDLEPQF